MATAEVAPDSHRAWWLRALLVLQAPRPVFAALRDDSVESVEARQEPVAALVFLGGVGAVLLAPRFGSLLDDPAIDGLLVAVIAVAAGGIYGFFSYWVFGWLCAAISRLLRGRGDPMRYRHVLAFAAAPLALSLISVWPLRLAIYGGDVFRRHGTDAGTGGAVLEWVCVGFAVWSVVLLGLGLWTVERPRSRA